LLLRTVKPRGLYEAAADTCGFANLHGAGVYAGSKAKRENKQLREFVAHLSELVLTRIVEPAEPGEQSGSAED
jgi:hypothetical protein